jgi:hypothetical protein
MRDRVERTRYAVRRAGRAVKGSVIVSIVRFRSGLTDGHVRDLYDARADRYGELPGLRESESQSELAGVTLLVGRRAEVI